MSYGLIFISQALSLSCVSRTRGRALATLISDELSCQLAFTKDAIPRRRGPLGAVYYLTLPRSSSSVTLRSVTRVRAEFLRRRASLASARRRASRKSRRHNHYTSAHTAARPRIYLNYTVTSVITDTASILLHTNVDIIA